MTYTKHKNFAVNVLGVVSSTIYDEMNLEHEAHNAAIRAARSAYLDAIGTDKESATLDDLPSILNLTIKNLGAN